MKIVTYNVNGIRSAIGKGLCDWIADERPDVLCLQETKAQPEQIPSEAFERMGYRCHYFSAVRKGYSGVAILTLCEPDRVVPGMGIERYDSEGRFLRADYGDLSVVSVYHPSGTSGDERQAFKMRWLDDFSDYVSRLLETRPKLILCGDFNICHRPIDIHDPVRNATVSGFLPEEREWIGRFIDGGFIDTLRFFHPEPHLYTWWSFRANARANNKGWRIDYAMASEAVRPMLRGARILPDVRHSDHCPMLLEIDFGLFPPHASHPCPSARSYISTWTLSMPPSSSATIPSTGAVRWSSVAPMAGAWWLLPATRRDSTVSVRLCRRSGPCGCVPT